MSLLPWVSVVVSLSSVSVALIALRTNGKRELRSFNRKLLTEQVAEVLVLVDSELSRIGAGMGTKDGVEVNATRYMELQYQLLSRKTIIEVVSPSCAQAIDESITRLNKFRSETDRSSYALLGATLNGLALMRGQLLVAHLRAVAHPRYDEMDIKRRAKKLKTPVDGANLGRIVGPGT